MKRKEDLFNLINAMSRSEKRYFTIDAKKSGKKGSKYLELFQMINGMNEYDEAKLRKKFSNIHADKSYLYEAILRSMRDYRSATSRAARIKELILDYKYLYEQGLYSQSEERLQEAKDLAKDYGYTLSLLEISGEERRLARITRKQNYETEVSKYIEESDKYLKHTLETLEYMRISDELFSEILRHFEYREEEDKNRLKERYPANLFSAERFPEGLQAQRRFYLSGFFYYQLLGAKEQILAFCSNIVSWWDKYEKLREEEFNWYVKDMANLLHASFRLDQFDYVPTILEQLQKVAPKNPQYQEAFFQRITIYQLMYYINIGNPKEGRGLIKAIADGLGKFKIRPIAKLVLIFNSVVLLFLLKDYENCILWCDRIIKEVKNNSRLDIQIGVRLLKLFATFELDDMDAFEKLYRNTYRYYTQVLSLSKESFEIMAIRQLFKIYQAPPSEQKRSLRAFRETLEISVKDKKTEVAMELDALLLKWVKTKKM